jgi:acylphosphatase
MPKHLTISGRVQGVGFRYGMAREACNLGVTDWVRNRRDGTVEAVVDGRAEAIESIIAWAQHGPPGGACHPRRGGRRGRNLPHLRTTPNRVGEKQILRFAQDDERAFSRSQVSRSRRQSAWHACAAEFSVAVRRHVCMHAVCAPEQVGGSSLQMDWYA